MDDARHDSGQNATTDDDAYEPREFVEGFIPSRRMDNLVAIIRDRRPWDAEAAVAGDLVAWSIRDTSTPIALLAAIDIAGCLAGFGRLDVRLNPELRADTTVAAIVWFWMANVAHGRDPLEYDQLADHIHGFPERTMRRWRREVGGLSLQPAFARIQRDLDLAALTRKGHTLVNARRWLLRHPGKHAADAPPPRRRGSKRAGDRSAGGQGPDGE